MLQSHTDKLVHHRKAESEESCPSRVLIVALTAMSLAEAQHQALNGGFDDFNTKPVNKSTLVDRVQRLTPQLTTLV